MKLRTRLGYVLRLPVRAAAALVRLAMAPFGRSRDDGGARPVGGRNSLLDGLRNMRTSAAPGWRLFLRFAIVLVGYAIFCAAEVGVGYQIVNGQFFLTSVALGGVLLLVLLARWPFAACAAWIIGSPYAKYFLEFKLAQGIPMLTFDGFVIPSLAVVLILRAMKNRRKLRRLETGEFLLVAYVIYVAASKFFRWELTPSTAKNIFLLGVGLWATIYFVFKSAIRTKDQIVKLAICLVCAAAWTGFTFIYEAYTGRSFYSAILGIDIALRWHDVGEGRSVGVFSSPVEPGHFMIVATFLAVHLMLHTKNAFAKLLYLAAASIIVFGLYHTYTRNNYICLYLVALLMPLLARDKRRVYVALVPAMITVALIVGSVAMSDSDIHKRFTAHTLDSRMVANKTAWSVIKHNPIFGVGCLNGLAATAQYVTDRSQLAYVNEVGLLTPLGVHNTYLQIIQEEGLVGALLYYGALLAFVVLGVKTWRELPSEGVLGKDIAAVILASIAPWLVSGLTYNSETSFYANGVFLVMFVVLARLREFNRAEQAAIAPTQLAVAKTGTGYDLQREVG